MNKRFSIIFQMFFFSFNILLLLFTLSESNVFNLCQVINITLLSFFLRSHLQQKKLSIFHSNFLAFFYFFFFIAPQFQLFYQDFPNIFTINDELIFKAEILILIFIFSYFLGRKNHRGKTVKINNSFEYINKTYFHFAIVLSLLFLFLKPEFIFPSKLQILNPLLYEKSFSKMDILVSSYFFSILPIFVWFYLYKKRDKHTSFTNAILLITSFILVIVFINPLNSKRNLMGAVYLTIMIIPYIKSINNIKMWVLSLFTIGLAFPLATIWTHADSLGINHELAINILSHLSREFTTLHYDAWQMIMATINYVEIHGIAQGKQLLGVLFFFFPRSYWPGKPGGTGHLIASSTGLSHTNISCPYLAEGFFNFGFIGVITFGVILGYVSKLCDNHLKDDNLTQLISIYTSFHVIFILRGDLMSSFAYLIGIVSTLYIFPKIFSKIKSYLNIANKRVILSKKNF